VGLAKAVIALASMTLDERNQLGKNGQKYAMQEFDRSRLMDRLENLLNEALNFAKSKL
jgi:glycosyltransferase involved in cell wall biosynthesis